MTLSYPIDVHQGTNDYVIFSAHDYRTNRAFVGQTKNKGGVSPPRTRGSSEIILYMPNSTPGVSNEQSWNQKSFEGPLGAMIGDMQVGATSAINQFGTEGAGSNAIQSIKDQFSKIGQSGGSAAKQFITKELAALSGLSASNLQAIASGQIYNPNIELLYEGPKLRSFAMAFNMIPKDTTERDMINKIIMEFKKWSSPSDNGAMFEVPKVWDVKFMHKNSQNRYMNSFKRAALTNVQVQANPSSDMHVTFDDGMPIVTSLGLTFQEVDIITREDHLTEAGNFQGY